MARYRPAQDKLERRLKTIERMRKKGIGCRTVAKEMEVSTVTLLHWYERYFGIPWGHGEPTGRKRTVPDAKILAAAEKHEWLYEAADSVGLSQPGFVHAFRRLTGISWRQYKRRDAPDLDEVRADLQREADRRNKSMGDLRDRFAVRLRKEGLTLGQIGEVLGMTESGICRLLQRLDARSTAKKKKTGSRKRRKG